MEKTAARSAAEVAYRHNHECAGHVLFFSCPRQLCKHVVLPKDICFETKEVDEGGFQAILGPGMCAVGCQGAVATGLFASIRKEAAE